MPELLKTVPGHAHKTGSSVYIVCPHKRHTLSKEKLLPLFSSYFPLDLV